MEIKRASFPNIKLHELGSLSLFLCFLFMLVSIVSGTQASYLDHSQFFDFNAILILFYLFAAVVISFIGLYNNRLGRSKYVMILLGAIMLLCFLIVEG